MNQLINHLSYEFIPIHEERERDKTYNIRYVCKIFENFVNLNKLRNVRSEMNVIEHMIVVWGRIFIKWLQNNDIKNESFIRHAIQAYFSLFSLNEGEEEFPNLANF